MTERQQEGAGRAVASHPESPLEEPATNGEGDEEVQDAVEAARQQAEERASAEILALEQDLERERELATRSLEEVQRRLNEAEARAAAGGFTVTDSTAREEAADWLREQRGDVRRELEAELERRMAARESKLIAERDEASAALQEALERLERTEREGGDTEQARAEAERKVREQADRRLREHTDQLKAQIASLQT